LRTRVQHVFLFQQPVYDRQGRAGFRELHAHHQRGGEPCGDGHRAEQGPRCDVRGPRNAAGEGSPGEGGDPLRAGVGIHAHPAELLHAGISQWTGQFERRAGPLFDGPRGWRGRLRPSSRFQDASQCERARTANGIYVPRFRNTPSNGKHSRFIRGYGYQGGADADFNFKAEGYGASLKKAVKDGVYGISLGAFGESLARWDNYIEIDRNLKDAWGIPALRISMTHGDNEAALMEDAGATAAEMLEAAGAEEIHVQTGVEMPGMAIHELGTARMGNDPKKSVLNAFNQAHDVKNLFVMDGASFVSSACQNPTLSMMAVTVRACDHLIERFRKNEV